MNRGPQVGETWRARMVTHHWNAVDDDSPAEGQRWLFRVVAEQIVQRKRFVLAAKIDWETGAFVIDEGQTHWFACGDRETLGDSRSGCFRLLARDDP